MNAGYNATIFEQGNDIIASALNADANSDITGVRVNAANYDRLYYLLTKPAGTAGDDLSFQVMQHTAASGGQSKALLVDRLYHKVGAIATTDKWTEVELTTPSADFDLDDINGIDLAADTAVAQILVEVIVERMDGQGGYTFLSMNHAGADIANALIVNGVWLGTGSRYKGRVPQPALA